MDSLTYDGALPAPGSTAIGAGERDAFATVTGACVPTAAGAGGASIASDAATSEAAASGALALGADSLEHAASTPSATSATTCSLNGTERADERAGMARPSVEQMSSFVGNRPARPCLSVLQA